MSEKDMHIAELQNLCKYTLGVLEKEKFFDKTSEDGFWYVSLRMNLIKASEGKELKSFKTMYNLSVKSIKELQIK